MSSLIRRGAGRIKRAVGSEPEWQKKKRVVDAQFDCAHGVDTGGTTLLTDVGVSRVVARESVAHVASDPDEFHSAMGALACDHSKFAFVDLGVGKGRAAMLASMYPFKRIIGVEFAAALLEDARKNLRAFAHPEQKCSTFELVHSDAAAYEFPQEPLIVFLYNPFGDETMRKVARRLRQSLEAAPREAVVLYLNPFQSSAWTETGFMEERGPHFAAYRLGTQTGG